MAYIQACVLRWKANISKTKASSWTCAILRVKVSLHKQLASLLPRCHATVARAWREEKESAVAFVSIHVLLLCSLVILSERQTDTFQPFLDALTMLNCHDVT